MYATLYQFYYLIMKSSLLEDSYCLLCLILCLTWSKLLVIHVLVMLPHIVPLTKTALAVTVQCQLTSQKEKSGLTFSLQLNINT